jgi:hypothetical protein
VLATVVVVCVIINAHPSFAVLDSADHVHVSDNGDGMPDSDPSTPTTTSSRGVYEEQSHPIGSAAPGQDGTYLAFDRTAWNRQDDPCRCSGSSALERPPRLLAAL